jgi:hypothetical protein
MPNAVEKAGDKVVPKCSEQHVWLLTECIDGHPHNNHSAQLRLR